MVGKWVIVFFIFLLVTRKTSINKKKNDKDFFLNKMLISSHNVVNVSCVEK